MDKDGCSDTAEEPNQCESVKWHFSSSFFSLTKGADTRVCFTEDMSMTIYGYGSGNEACACAHNSISDIHKSCICAVCTNLTPSLHMSVCKVFVYRVSFIWPLGITQRTMSHKTYAVTP